MKDEKSVLIVEDEGLLALIYQRYFQKLGYKVTGVINNGEEAIRVALESIPDLIFTDIMLTGKLDGVQAVKEIHKSIDIPVIYITGFENKHFEMLAKKTKYLAYLKKPIMLEDLAKALESLT